VQVALYRIAQEALNNAAKHAEAQHVQVDLQCISPDPCADRSLHSIAVELCVADDGRGFDVAHLPPGGKGLGLNIMRERAEAAGAALHVESRPGQGTRVTFIWPAGEKT
jgi:signal transduction histidine kinase